MKSFFAYDLIQEGHGTYYEIRKGVKKMSVDGTYKVRVKTPMGVQEGKMTLLVEGNSLKGMLESKAGRVSFTDGRIKGNAIEFSVKINTALGHVSASVTGTVTGNRFSGIARVPFGSVEIDGVRL